MQRDPALECLLRDCLRTECLAVSCLSDEQMIPRAEDTILERQLLGLFQRIKSVGIHYPGEEGCVVVRKEPKVVHTQLPLGHLLISQQTKVNVDFRFNPIGNSDRAQIMG